MLRYLFIFIFALLAFYFTGEKSSAHSKASQAPVLNAGAPDMSSCNSSGCHEGTVNDGNGSTLLDFSGENDEYIPGQHYTITVAVEGTGSLRYGFQMIARNENNQQAGSFVADTANKIGVQIIAGLQFIGHKNIPNPNQNNFSFEWVAPSSDQGVITFWAAGNAANGDNGRNGDHIYTSSMQINPNLSNIDLVLSGALSTINFSDKRIQFYAPSTPIEEILIADIQGHTLYHTAGLLPSAEVSMGTWMPGCYLIKIRCDGELRSSKFILH